MDAKSCCRWVTKVEDLVVDVLEVPGFRRSFLFFPHCPHSRPSAPVVPGKGPSPPPPPALGSAEEGWFGSPGVAPAERNPLSLRPSLAVRPSFPTDVLKARRSPLRRPFWWEGSRGAARIGAHGAGDAGSEPAAAT